MKDTPVTHSQAAPQIKVRTDLQAGENCQQDVNYYRNLYNQLERKAKQLGCTVS